MLRRLVNGYDMAYVEVGEGESLVCLHGSLCDYRVWSPVLGPLSHTLRVIAPSLRRFFPEHWDGVGDGFTIAQHVTDAIAFLEALEEKVHLLGHSRGGYIAFRVAQQRPDLLRSLVLAEPGGDLDPSLSSGIAGYVPDVATHVVAAVERISADDIDGGLASFVDTVNGRGVWRSLPAATKQKLRDNARTLLGQLHEERPPFTRADAEALRVPTLFIGGTNTPGMLPIVLRTLAEHVPSARLEMIAHTTHMMFEQDPVGFSSAVLDFIAATSQAP